MDLVNIYLDNSVSIKILYKFFERVIPEPEVIQRNIECLINILVFLKYPLKQKSRFTDTPCSFYPDNSRIPIDLTEKISLEIQIHLFYLSVIIIHQRLNIILLHNIIPFGGKYTETLFKKRIFNIKSLFKKRHIVIITEMPSYSIKLRPPERVKNPRDGSIAGTEP